MLDALLAHGPSSTGVSDRELLDFAATRWGPYQGYAGLYLTTNTDAWAKKLGIAFRLRSGALSDPDVP